jgi:hypothetical protein
MTGELPEEVRHAFGDVPVDDLVVVFEAKAAGMRLAGWNRALHISGVPQDSWRKRHTRNWWVWFAPKSAVLSADAAYAYRVGFDRGFRGSPLGAPPAEFGGRPDVLDALALGHARGQSRRAARKCAANHGGEAP